jgi:signal transduction histidine kinase
MAMRAFAAAAHRQRIPNVDETGASSHDQQRLIRSRWTMAATLSKLVTLVSSIAHQLAERVRAVARIASRERPIYGVARDVTEHRDVERELQRAQRELEGCRDELRVLADEQASLRRIAVLVAAGAASADVFAAIAREVAHVLRPRLVQIFRWERDGSVTVVGTWGDGPNPFPAGSNWPWEDPSLFALMERMRAGELIRIEDVAGSLAGELADAGLSVNVGSAAGAPIVVDGETWGHMSVEMTKGAALPDGVEERLAELTEVVATAISSIATREQLARLADEQAALRRVATLVARGAPPADVFDAVAGELGRLLEVGSSGLLRFEDEHRARVVAGWGRLDEVAPVGARLPIGGKNVITEIARTGKTARIDDFERTASGTIGDQARRLNTRSSIGGPIVVAGRLWGAIVAAALEGDPLPPDGEPRLEQFAELIATAIANTEGRLELARLAEEQAALRRVATLVAQEAPAADLLAKVAEEVAGVFGERIDSAILRLERDATATVVAVWGEQPPGGIRVDARLPLDGSGVTARVFREGRPVRVDDYATADGAIADHAQTHGIRAAVGCPIQVQGRVWGAMVVAHYEPEPFPAEAERRVSQFTELVATGIANAEARAEVQRLADEQAALRRVATLVAEGAPPTEVFDAVIVEAAQLLGAAQVGMMRSETAQEVTILAHRGQDPAVVRAGMCVPLDGDSVTARVLRTGRSARINHSEERSGTIAEIAHRSNVNLTVGAPIVVEGRLWGVITASWEGQDLPPVDAEERLTEFAQLLDTAIANADSRDQLTASRARVLTAGDEARRRVVRDLHDGGQQRLVHTIVTLKLAQRALSEDTERAGSLLAEALDHAERGNAELRELAHGILPAVLTRGGLRAGVDALVSRLDLLVEVDVTSTRLPPEIEASAYFIVAEALTNVVKHSRAARAQVTAAIDDGTLSVEVRDDGIGGADPEGHGLLGIGDRAAALGGRLRIDSPPGGGTILAAELPMPE